MRSVFFVLTVATILSAVLPAPVNAEAVTLDANNVTPLAATVVPSNSGSWHLNGDNLAAVNNNVVDDGSTGFLWNELFMFDDTATPNPPYTLDLTWTTGQNINSLQAYVMYLDGTSGWDGSTSNVQFYVKEGSGSLALAGSVSVPAERSIGPYWSLVELDGSWSDVTAVRYEFTCNSALGHGPRVAEVLAISSIPEPSTICMLVIGLFGLLAYAWRKRK